MRFTVKMPRVAETVDEVVVVQWLVEPGEAVSEGGALMTVESDKAVVEVPAPVSGKLIEHLVSVDQEVATGTPIAVVEA